MINKWIMVNIDQLIEADWNYKNDDEESAKKLLENIRRNGQLETIIVRLLGDDRFEVVNGNHRLVAFRALGMNEVMCCNLGVVTLAHAKRIAVETNETRFSNNEARLSEILRDISLEFALEDLAKTLPMGLDLFEDRIASVDFKLNDFTGKDVEKTLIASPAGYTDEKFRTVSYRLPEGVADQLEAQVRRFKIKLHPDENPVDVSPVMAIEAMCQHLAQISDDQLL